MLKEDLCSYFGAKNVTIASRDSARMSEINRGYDAAPALHCLAFGNYIKNYPSSPLLGPIFCILLLPSISQDALSAEIPFHRTCVTCDKPQTKTLKFRRCAVCKNLYTV
jgi:hypothetical protein